MRRPPRPGVAVAVVLAVLAVATLAPAGASSPPRPACPACGTLFEQAADDRGADVTVRESRALVQVHANGSATWTIRNRLNATDGLDGGTLDGIARERTDGYGPPDDATLRDARLEANVAVVVLYDADAAERHAGLLMVDYLNADGEGTGIRMNADLFRVRGPAGTVVTNAPAGAVEDGRTAAWTGRTGDAVLGARKGVGEARVVIGPASTSGIRTNAALALATLPVVIETLGRFVLGQTFLFALGLGVAAYAVRGSERDPTTLGGGFVACGVAAVVVPAIVYGPDWLWITAPALAAIPVGVAATRPAVRERRWTPRSLAVGAVLALAGAAAALFALELAVGGSGPLGTTMGSLAVAGPLVACLPLGAALARDRRTAAAWGGVVVLGFIVMTLTIVDPVDPPTGLGGGVLLAFLSIAAVVGPMLCAPVLALGRALATPRAE